MDTNMEIVGDFSSLHNSFVKEGKRFVGSNEDPCGWKCVGKDENKYLSNGFFGTVQGGEVIQNTIDPTFLKTINFHSKFVNQETGPYYLRKCVTRPRKLKATLIPTSQVYPFNVNESNYRETEANKCISTTKTKKHTYKLYYSNNSLYLETPCKKYKNAVLMNHFLGGSWNYK